MLPFRRATPADLPALAALYRDAVHTLGPLAYTPAQVAAWAATADEPRFEAFVLGPETLIVEDETGPIGFAGWRPDGHVASLYVRPDRTRQGLGLRLLTAVIESAQAAGVTRLHSEASVFSRPVFERAGFLVTGTEDIERRGATFTRYLVALDLNPSPAIPPRPS
ncbi:MAG: GNAT family N-acetyltransferase [Bacteroidota bacterium]